MDKLERYNNPFGSLLKFFVSRLKCTVSVCINCALKKYNYHINMEEYITILGSCRQQPISKYYKCSNIQELNYPHYTKEILQQIKYLKNKNISSENTKYCFRNGLLGKCKHELSDKTYDMLVSEFNNTTTFLVEIASRISYEWNGLYLHHIADEETYEFPYRKDIKKRDLTDEEIENDLIEIRKELYPKKLIIISHFSTYKKGKRYQLISLLRDLCQKLDIPFFDQTEVVETHENVILEEKVLAHFNDKGNIIIGNILKNKVDEVRGNFEKEKNKKYQVYYTDEDRFKKYTYHGFGDYIRGCIFMYHLSKKFGFELCINFSNHLLSNFFYCKNHLSIDECQNTEYIFSGKKTNN